jgi:hypothetical protein
MTQVNSQRYEQDFYAWTMENADLIRKGKLADLDLEHIAEELETMGRSERRELLSRLTVLLAHLLKWQYQPERRSTSWQLTLKVQRRDANRVLEDNPSLKAQRAELLADAYRTAVLIAASETNLAEHAFPSHCAFTFEQVLDEAFLPE